MTLLNHTDSHSVLTTRLSRCLHNSCEALEKLRAALGPFGVSKEDQNNAATTSAKADDEMDVDEDNNINNKESISATAHTNNSTMTAVPDKRIDGLLNGMFHQFNYQQQLKHQQQMQMQQKQAAA
jgi:hypothetical protein